MDEPLYSRLGAAVEPPVIVALMKDALAAPNLRNLAAGFTSNETLPQQLVLEIVRELGESKADAEHLQYGTNTGRRALREATLKHLRTYPHETLEGLEARDCFISNGSQQALFLALQVLCDPGDYVLVESPTYFVFLEALKGLQIRPLPMPMTEAGEVDQPRLREKLEQLEAAGEAHRLKAAYLVAYHANPSARSISRKEKLAILASLRDTVGTRPVLEDAAYRDLYHEAPWSAPSLLSMPGANDFPCCYFGTYTKPFSSGLKVGYVLSNHRDLLDRMASFKGQQDFGTANFNQAILERLLVSERYEAHLDIQREHYRRKREIMLEALEASRLAEAGWRWRKPVGGFLNWLIGPKGVETGSDSALWKHSLEREVMYVPGSLCDGAGALNNCLRLSYGAESEARLREGIARLAEAALTI